MEVFVQQLINGITLGSVYGLIAIGYTMVFGIIGMVNFAHGEVFMIGAVISLIIYVMVTTVIGVSAGAIFFALMMCLVIGILTTSILNWAIEKVAYRPLRGSFRLAPLISALGMSYALKNFVNIYQFERSSNKSVPSIITGNIPIMTSSDGFEVVLNDKNILIVLVTVVLLTIFWYLVQKTSLGRAQRACEQDRKMASLLGIDVDRTIAITFAIGAALAAVAGVLYLVYYSTVSYNDGTVPGIKAFTAAVLGGIGSLPGAVLGGLLIGIIEIMWSNYVSSDYKDVAVFAILIVVLIMMPQGILGKPEVEKV
ncbi:MAG: branched-chain amino acid ABC transporter permease LivH [Beijerinckiaceae bacterium]|nr:branched-chain amino acid ABC transporter permease LivH [Beijerinckiaceae bacterium]